MLKKWKLMPILITSFIPFLTVISCSNNPSEPGKELPIEQEPTQEEIDQKDRELLDNVLNHLHVTLDDRWPLKPQNKYLPSLEKQSEEETVLEAFARITEYDIEYHSRYYSPDFEDVIYTKLEIIPYDHLGSLKVILSFEKGTQKDTYEYTTHNKTYFVPSEYNQYLGKKWVNEINPRGGSTKLVLTNTKLVHTNGEEYTVDEFYDRTKSSDFGYVGITWLERQDIAGWDDLLPKLTNFTGVAEYTDYFQTNVVDVSRFVSITTYGSLREDYLIFHLNVERYGYEWDIYFRINGFKNINNENTL